MAVVYEQTPNPNALKFVVSREVRGDKGPLYYKKDPKSNPKADAPLAYQLFQFDGVADVFFGSNFITVGKKEEVDWGDIRTEVMDMIREYDDSNNPFILEEVSPACDDINSDVGVSKTEKQIKQLLDDRVRPAVAQDGGDIIFHSFKEGIVYLEMYGACSGCPSSTATLKMGIENMLRHYIPEVNRVEPI